MLGISEASCFNLMNRDGDKVDLYSYAHCIEEDCTCKSENESTSCGIGTRISSAVTLQLHRGFYHDRFRDISKVSASFSYLFVTLSFPLLFIQSLSSWEFSHLIGSAHCCFL